MHLLSVDRVGGVGGGSDPLRRRLLRPVLRRPRRGRRPQRVGKTTLLRILAGDRDRTPAGRPRSGLRIGWLPQDPRPARRHAGRSIVVLAATRWPARRGGGAARPGGRRPRPATDRDVRRPAPPGRAGPHPARPERPAGARRADQPPRRRHRSTGSRRSCAPRTCGLVLVTHDRYVLERLTNRMLDLCPRRPASPPRSVARRLVLVAARGPGRARRARQRATARARNLLRKEVAWLRAARRRAPPSRSSASSRSRCSARPPPATPTRRRWSSAPAGAGSATTCSSSRACLDPPRRHTRCSTGVDLGIGPGRAGRHRRPERRRQDHPAARAGRPAPRRGRGPPSGARSSSGSTSRRHGPPGADRARQRAGDRPARAARQRRDAPRAHRLAERFGFDGRCSAPRSGCCPAGERRRVALLHLLVAAPNVLLLDEPTNDLDLDTLAVLEDHLDGFTGTLVVASATTATCSTGSPTARSRRARPLTEHLDWELPRAGAGRARRRRGAAARRRRSGSASAAGQRRGRPPASRSASSSSASPSWPRSATSCTPRWSTAATDPERLMARCRTSSPRSSVELPRPRTPGSSSTVG
jgi:ABC transport system ATP-binding/permease protein